MVELLSILALGYSGPNVESMTIGGVKRVFEVFAPSKPGKNPPIVFCFHGHGGTMQNAANLFNVQGVWPEAVVVCPQGLNGPSPVDPAGHKPGWENQPGDFGDRDLKFFDAMYQKMEHDFGFNHKQVYSMGFSNGATFSYVLWSQRHDKLAAIGEVAGRVWDATKPLSPLPAFMVAGQKDTTDPFPLQVASIKYVRTVDGVAPNATPNTVNGIRHFHGSNADIAVYIHPGAHVYPPGITTPMVTFFKHHPQ